MPFTRLPGYNVGHNISQADAWAVGVLAYELMVGHAPFEKETRLATYESILYSEPEFPPWLSHEAVDFIKAALQKVSLK